MEDWKFKINVEADGLSESMCKRLSAPLVKNMEKMMAKAYWIGKYGTSKQQKEIEKIISKKGLFEGSDEEHALNRWMNESRISEEHNAILQTITKINARIEVLERKYIKGIISYVPIQELMNVLEWLETDKKSI